MDSLRGYGEMFTCAKGYFLSNMDDYPDSMNRMILDSIYKRFVYARGAGRLRPQDSGAAARGCFAVQCADRRTGGLVPITLLAADSTDEGGGDYSRSEIGRAHV